MKFTHPLLLTALLLAPLAALHAADEPAQITRPDIVLADFEQGYTFGPDNAPWTVEGEAFNHPTTRIQGTTGFVGKGIANSWDDPNDNQSLAGTLSSPVSTIERNFIRFLVAGPSSLQLLIDGKPEFYASGVQDRQMRPVACDVSSFQGRKAQLVASDGGTSDSDWVAVDKQMDLTGMRYLTLPINKLAPTRVFVLEVDGQRRMNININLAIDAPVDFWASYPLEGGLSGQELKGQKLRFYSTGRIVLNTHAEALLKQINLSAQPRDMDGVYQEPGRPQLSFTVKRGHNADPDGLFFYEGLWHMFYQYNPVGLFQSSHWGYATSPDLFHWTEHGIGIRWGVDWRAYSGSAVVDHNNDSGLKQGSHPPILLFFNKVGRDEIATPYSVDGGKTFREYERNPPWKLKAIDPKVVWYAPEKKWVMIISPENGGFDFYESKNLLDWKYLSTTTGWHVVPDLFPLLLDGDRSKIKWVVSGGSGGGPYKIGDFNGREFIPETEKLMAFQGKFFAMQTFYNAPDGRRVMMAPLPKVDYSKDDPSLHVGGGMNIPVELTLRTSPTGPRLYLNPVKEIETLISAREEFPKSTIADLSAKLAAIQPGLFDIEFEWDAAESRDFQLKVWDRDLFTFTSKDSSYAIGNQKGKVIPVNGTIKVRLICDRSLVSFYINDGYEAGNSYLGKFVPECKRALSLQGDGGTLFKTFQVRTLRPTWKPHGK